LPLNLPLTLILPPYQFTLRVLGDERLQRLLERAKERWYCSVPWPVGVYDACPGWMA
jgi:hypothetical protein